MLVETFVLFWRDVFHEYDWLCCVTISEYILNSVAAKQDDCALVDNNVTYLTLFVGETGGNCNIFHIYPHYVEQVFY